jgi:hypothetical protein
MCRSLVFLKSLFSAVFVLALVAGVARADDVIDGVKRNIAQNIQATASAGVVIRVKEVLVAEDVTLVSISASYSGETSLLNLADTDSGTYLQDENGQKFPLRKPTENRWLRIKNGDTMHGKLVFLGVVSPTSKKITLVFNDGNDGGDLNGPGLSIDVPLL